MSHILVADDDALQLGLQKQLLEMDGHQVETALTALQVVRCLQSAPADLASDLVIDLAIDLVIMDLRFPNALGESDPREGIALIRCIRERGYRVPIIVISGWPYDLYGEPEESLVSCILLKPVKTPELHDTIRRLLR
jgi:CheY-like chemotaxis protein